MAVIIFQSAGPGIGLRDMVMHKCFEIGTQIPASPYQSRSLD